MKFLVSDLSTLDSVAQDILKAFPDNRVFAFVGEMGAGKTTFTKSLCKALGVTDATSSPTFSIVNEYLGSTGPIYHFDFYRLKDEQEAFDLGYEEYFYSSNYCFIEWPQKIENLIPDDCKIIRINIIDPNTREIQID